MSAEPPELPAAPERGFVPLALCDRAYAFLSGLSSLSSREPVDEAALLAHVYGGAPPAALRARLAEPLLADPRLLRRPDGQWTVSGKEFRAEKNAMGELGFTTLALVATGPRPDRGRVVQVAALHVHHGTTIERFSSTMNPAKRVPHYVSERIGLAPEMLDDLPPVGAIFDDLLRFLDERPVVAQDARLTWAFIEAEARRLGNALADRVLIDANELATHLLDLRGKPSLALVAAHLDIGMHRQPRPDEEARVLGLVTTRLLAIAAERGLRGVEAALEARASDGRAALRDRATVQALPEVPGVYVLRDSNDVPLYVGKARQLRSRMAAYVNRPLGATRRLEGLVGAVDSVDSVECATDLEALILEDREIRRWQPRFNTVRQQRAPRLWIRLPPTPAAQPGKKRPAALVRLELSRGPTEFGNGVDGEFVGPFRNESLAEQARLLARRVFGLDALRRADPTQYAAQLNLAWGFLRGQNDTAIVYARHGSAALLRQVLDFDWPAALLPADPRVARYAVLRPAPGGIEAFRVDRGILYGWLVKSADVELTVLSSTLLAAAVPRTTPEDVDVVLRWFGAQRPPACLVHLPDDPLAAGEAIEDAASGLVDWLLYAAP